MKILHIAAHMGGGIGAAYVGLSACGQEQSVLLLEKPIDQKAVANVRSAGFRVLIQPSREEAERELGQADIVVFSWHHHPALTKFLHDLPPIPIRSVLWCHVSGNYFPNIPAEFVRKFDQVLFTSPYSLELPQFRELGEDWIKQRCSVVYGLNDLSGFYKLRRKPGGHFTIGYVGTLGFCKLHPDFVDYCAAVNIPGTRFLMAGAPSTKERILRSAAEKGIAVQFEFCGQLGDVTQALEQMDVFGYLLNPQHFGTTENALLEAMAAGLPVIALDQCVEQHIVQDGVTGLLVRSPEEYGNAIRYLRQNQEEAARLGARAREFVMKNYGLDKNRERFLAACRRAAGQDKTAHRFDDFFSGEPANWFLSCVKDDRECFTEGHIEKAGLIFRERTKGSPIHYYNYFREDKLLASWAARQSD